MIKINIEVNSTDRVFYDELTEVIQRVVDAAVESNIDRPDTTVEYSFDPHK